MKARRTGPFGGFAGELADRGLRGRWLWAIPAAGLAARRLIGGVLDGGKGRGAASVVAGLARIAQDYLVIAASLVGCVAAPIEAFRSGRLVEP